MKTKRGGDAISFSGPPGNTAAVISLDPTTDRIVPVFISVAGQPASYRAVVRPSRTGGSQIRLRLPSGTPPGTYRGQGTVDGMQREIVVDVEPVTRLRAQPKQTHLSAAPGASAEFGLSIHNGGNVPFEVPASDTVDLDDAAGQDRALGRTLRASLASGERRIDRYFEELLGSHGGEARVVVKVGAGRLEPGESRELTCRLDIPATAQPGRSYLGAWQLGNAVHAIAADIVTGPRSRNGRTKS